LLVPEAHEALADVELAGGFDDATPRPRRAPFVPDDLTATASSTSASASAPRTSKFRKLWVAMQYPTIVDDLFERGQSLSQARVDYTGGALFASRRAARDRRRHDPRGRRPARRATLGRHRARGRAGRGRGRGRDPAIDGVTWALGEKPDVVLYEMAPWTGVALDGSDALSSPESTPPRSEIT